MDVAAGICMNNDIDIPIPAIEFRNVSLSFDDRLALNDVSFSLAKEEMILLTGESGSGKSVLLRLAIGLLKPDSGQIFINGQEIENLGESDLIALRGGLMGMAFQEESLFTGISTYENAAYRLEELGWAPEEIDKAVNEVLEFVGLENDKEKFPEELSGGMKRRLEIARALIGWPRIMLYDEPTMSLDPIAAIKVLNLLLRARDINHISSLYVTKKIHEIEYLSRYRAERDEKGDVRFVKATATNPPKTKVVVLESGRVVFCGTVEEFDQSDLPSIKELLTLDRHDHKKDPYFDDPWDKNRRPAEQIL